MRALDCLSGRMGASVFAVGSDFSAEFHHCVGLGWSRFSSLSISLAEMASTVTPTYKKPLVFGHFEWIEELKRHDQCISYHTPLKIIEHEEIAHVKTQARCNHF